MLLVNVGPVKDETQLTRSKQLFTVAILDFQLGLKQQSTFSVFTQRQLNTRRVGRILEGYSRHNCLEFSEPSSLDEAM